MLKWQAAFRIRMVSLTSRDRVARLTRILEEWLELCAANLFHDPH